MIEQTDLAGSFKLPDNSMAVNRMGCGAMQLAGPGVWGPPRDLDGLIPGTSSVGHFRENLKVAALQITDDVLSDSTQWEQIERSLNTNERRI
jgi:hypothetical protein